MISLFNMGAFKVYVKVFAKGVKFVRFKVVQLLVFG